VDDGPLYKNAIERSETTRNLIQERVQIEEMEQESRRNSWDKFRDFFASNIKIIAGINFIVCLLPYFWAHEHLQEDPVLRGLRIQALISCSVFQ
jgi:hypothetical protein